MYHNYIQRTCNTLKYVYVTIYSTFIHKLTQSQDLLLSITNILHNQAPFSYSFLFFYPPRCSTSYIIFHYNIGTKRLINERVVTLPTERHVLTRASTRGCGTDPISRVYRDK